MNDALRKVLRRLHYPIEVMLVRVRWYAAYPLSLRQIEEMMAERGVVVDHTTVHRWSIKMMPILAAAMRRRKRPIGPSWRMDETYVKVGGQWKALAVRTGVKTSDIVRSYMSLLVQGKSDFEAIENFRGDTFYKQVLGIELLPSSATLRQRLDARASEWFDFLPTLTRQLNARFGSTPAERVH